MTKVVAGAGILLCAAVHVTMSSGTVELTFFQPEVCG